MAQFKNTSNSYNGKNLKAIVRIDEKTIVEANIYYKSEYEQKVNDYGVKWNETTGLYSVVMNATRMVTNSNSDMYSGGLGRTVEFSRNHKRRTLKELEKVAEQLTDEAIIAAAGRNTEASLVF